MCLNMPTLGLISHWGKWHFLEGYWGAWRVVIWLDLARHEEEIAKLRDMVAVEARRGRSWNTYIFSHRDLRFYHASLISSSNSQDQIYKTKMVQESNNKWKLTQGRNRQFCNLPRCASTRNIPPLNSQNQNFQNATTMAMPCHGTYTNYL